MIAPAIPLIECMCGNVICGRFDPSQPFFTARGSFWTNCTTELLASTTEADRQARTRNRCNGQGYESVALIALAVGDDRLGLLQFNDRRKGRFTAEGIALWERLAGYLAVALAKALAESGLQTTLQRFYGVLSNMYSGVLLVTDEGRVEFANQAFCDRFGLEDAPADLVGLAAGHAREDQAGLPASREALAAHPGNRRRRTTGQGRRNRHAGRADVPEEFCPRQYKWKVAWPAMGSLRYHRTQAHRSALEEARNYLENLIAYANAPIIVWNPDFKITRFNHAFER